jgi:sphingolipid delta-4 desaturase
MTTVQDDTKTDDASEQAIPGGFQARINWRVVGSAAPVFPGFEVDVCQRVPDAERPDAVWHRERARAMLKAHPEIRDLFGHHAGTAFWCILMAGLQVGLAASCAHWPWWGMLGLAFVLGGAINITLFQLAHECDHCLVFKKSFWNRYLFTLTSLPMFLSAHHTWWVEHIVHHNDLGATKDFITRRRSFFLLTRYTPPLFVPYSLFMLVCQVFRSAAGLVLYVFTSLLRGRLDPTPLTVSVLADEHLVSGYQKQRITRWAVVYPLMNFSMCGGLMVYGYSVAGWYGMVMPIVYLLVSQAFMTGWMNPYCLGWVLGISHFHGTRRYQPTASNYARFINLITFNAGLHVEHHDLMGIPWFRLWRLREVAPEFYDELDTIKSYTWLGLHFVFGSRETYEKNFNNEAHRNLERFAKGKSAPAETAV